MSSFLAVFGGFQALGLTVMRIDCARIGPALGRMQKLQCDDVDELRVMGHASGVAFAEGNVERVQRCGLVEASSRLMKWIPAQGRDDGQSGTAADNPIAVIAASVTFAAWKREKIDYFGAPR